MTEERPHESGNSLTPDAVQGPSVGETVDTESLEMPATQSSSESLLHRGMNSEVAPVAIPKPMHQYPRCDRRPPERWGDYVT